MFTFNGEIVPTGSTVTVSEYELAEAMEGVMNIFEMQSGLAIKNVSGGDDKVSLHAIGIENFLDIQICPDGNCRPWIDGEITADFKDKIPAGESADCSIHVSYMDMTCSETLNYKGSVKLEAYSYYDEEDITSITLVFDTSASGSGIKKVKADKKCEVFNLCGKKIADSTTGLTKGIYIIKQNGTSRKVVIK